MALLKWLQRGASESSQKLPAVPAAQPAPEPVWDVVLDARRLASAWNTVSGRLVLAGMAAPQEGGRVAIEVVEFAGIVPKVTGTVAEQRLEGRSCVTEIVIDADRRLVVTRVADFVANGRDRPRQRAPRYRLSLPATVLSRDGSTLMSTYSVSKGGAGISWSGTRPSVGSVLYVRLGSGTGAASLRAMVCWVREEAKRLRVGVRFVAGQDAQLGALIERSVPSAMR
jgi:hypothetical protein